MGRNSVRYDGLDSLRGIAAILVICFHIWALNLLRFPDGVTTIVNKLGIGVQMFFILSAFCLCIGYHGKLNSSDGIKKFAIRRFFRIAPLFYALIPIWIAISYFKRGHPTPISDIVLNLAFLFNFPPSTDDVRIVWASWTIGVEMVSYLLFPFAIIACNTWRKTSLALVGSVLIAFAYQLTLQDAKVSTSFVWSSFTSQAPFFVLGILCWQAFRALESHQQRINIGRVLFVSALVYWLALAAAGLWSWELPRLPLYKYLISVGFAPLIISQVLAPNKLIVNRATIYLGARGYSIYLLHPIIVLYTIPFVRKTLYDPESLAAKDVMPYLAACAIVCAIVVFLAHWSYALIEQPGQEFGRRLASRRERPLIQAAPAE